MIIDIAMLVMMPLLMAYTLIGAQFHEIVGTAIFVLFIVHHILNRGWYRSLARGRYSALRITQTVMDIALLAFMIAQPISGILLSGYLFRFIHEPAAVTNIARTVHLILAYWGYVLICFHAGWHIAAPLRKLKNKSRKIWLILILVLAGVSVYGCTAFFRRQFPTYMFGKTHFVFFDFREPKIYFFIDYIAIMVLFMMIGAIVMTALNKKRKRNLG